MWGQIINEYKSKGVPLSKKRLGVGLENEGGNIAPAQLEDAIIPVYFIHISNVAYLGYIILKKQGRVRAINIFAGLWVFGLLKTKGSRLTCICDFFFFSLCLLK